MKILHTADWQLGMTRHFLDEDAQARFSEARNEAIRRMGELADEHDAACIVVSGDVFDANHVDRRTVLRALAAMGDVSVPVYLLPGNHDPLDPATVYRSSTFLDNQPANVHVLEDGPVQVNDELELLGAPWRSKRPFQDLVQARLSEEEDADRYRVLVAHGGVDALSPDPEDPSLIELEGAEAAVEAGIVDYIALGDKHSTEEVGDTGRIWYAGAPEPTAYNEPDPGNALLVDLGSTVQVTALPVARWRFEQRDWSLDGGEDLQRLEAWLEGIQAPARTLLKLSFVGTLNLREKAQLDGLLGRARELHAAVEIWDRHTDLAVLADEGDLGELDLSGFGRTTLDRLDEMAKGSGGEAQVASDAMGLLYRLAGGGRA